VQGISDIITIPGIINRDFADVKNTMAGMGHAVMGTAVRSGANRVVEAARAAMASPYLEAGAMNGARGILINITGSSSLKLSEVNEASMLIQSAAHEDANIIFGAVQDEKMGEEVKITVIASGFREQMPERRARMLNVEETPVISIPQSPAPVAQISLVPRNDEIHEPVAAPVLAPKPARFQSQEEEENEAETAESEKAAEEEAVKAEDSSPWGKDGFFTDPAPSEPATDSKEPPMEAAAAMEPEKMEPAAAPAPPRLAEIAEEPAYTPPPRQYYPTFTNGERGPAALDENRAGPDAMLFPSTEEDTLPDLERPTFLRNLRL
jgi:cell division protein FtsZ